MACSSACSCTVASATSSPAAAAPTAGFGGERASSHSQHTRSAGVSSRCLLARSVGRKEGTWSGVRVYG